jgi:hypothetical protein
MAQAQRSHCDKVDASAGSGAPGLFVTFPLPLPSNSAALFVVKAACEDDVHKSIKYCMWCSSISNNKIFDERYRNSNGAPVFLLFSVHQSGRFVGLARVTGLHDPNKTIDLFAQPRWQGSFPVQWLAVRDLAFGPFRHITLPNKKSCVSSRDGQEIRRPQAIAILDVIAQQVQPTASEFSLLQDFPFYDRRQQKMEKKRDAALAKAGQLPKRLITGAFVIPSPIGIGYICYIPFRNRHACLFVVSLYVRM